MSNVKSFSFEFDGKVYFAIVRRRKTEEGTRMHVRIMNHRLDNLLGKKCNNIFFGDDSMTIVANIHKNDRSLSQVVFQELLRDP